MRLTTVLARVATAAALAALVLARGTAQTPLAPMFPGATWDHVTDVRAAGYCTDKLDLVTERLKTLTTTAMTVVAGGRVLLEYGPQDEVTYLASVRKSILAMMYGSTSREREDQARRDDGRPEHR